MSEERREEDGEEREGDWQTSHYIYEEIGPLRVRCSSVGEIFHNPLLYSYECAPSRGSADTPNVASRHISQTPRLSM